MDTVLKIVYQYEGFIINTIGILTHIDEIEIRENPYSLKYMTDGFEIDTIGTLINEQKGEVA